VKFGQSLATCGSEWEEIRVKGIYRGEKRVTFGQKRVTFFGFVTVKFFETTTNVSRLGKT